MGGGEAERVLAAVRKGGTTDADLGGLSRWEKHGAFAGRARAASEALVSVAVCAAGIETTRETLACCSLGQNHHEAFESEKECFYQWQLFSGGLSIDVLEVTLGSFSGELQAGLKKQASFQPKQVGNHFAFLHFFSWGFP